MKSKGCFIVDAHTHLSPLGLYTTAPRPEDYEAAVKKDIQGFMNWMDRFNVSAAAVSSITPMTYRVWKTRHDGNQEVVELMKRCPGRIVGQYVPNVYEGPEVVKDKIDEAVERYGFKGIKLHPWVSGFPANAPIVYPVFEAAGKHGLSVLFHSGTAPYCTPLLIADIAMKFPDVPVIMGHMGKHELYLDVLPAAKLSPNIYLETSGHEIQAMLEKVIREIGAERLLFGTDGPGDRFQALVFAIEDLDATEEAKEWILGRSAAKVFGIEEAP